MRIKRDKKISADISSGANDMLNELINEYDRSKGWLLDKMIRKFHQESIGKEKKKPVKAKSRKSTKFVKPTAEEAGNYFAEKGFSFDMGQQFVDHYTTNGWLVGRMKAPMKDWKAAVRTWLVNKTPESTTKEIEIKTPSDCIGLIKKGQITSIRQIPKEHRKIIETQYMLGNYKPETMAALENIGMTI